MNIEVFLRRCRKCKTKKKLDLFPRSRVDREGRSWVCRECHRLGLTRADRNRKLRADCLRRKFDITIEEYENFLRLQKGRCAVCRRPGGKRCLAVDHCHKTGIIRGLLCVRCNLVLGALGDDRHYISRFVDYLRNPPWQNAGVKNETQRKNRHIPKLCQRKNDGRLYVTDPYDRKPIYFKTPEDYEEWRSLFLERLKFIEQSA